MKTEHISGCQDTVQWPLVQHGFKLHWSICTWIFPYVNAALPFQPKVPWYLHFLCIMVLHLWIQPTVGRVVLHLHREKSMYKWTSAV